MKPPQRVVWSEGLLISPQHLQQADLYHERVLDARLAAAVPQSWGVVSIDIDAGALGGDQLKLGRFVGVMPDGLTLAFEGGDAECPPARPLQGKLAPTKPVLEVFLGVVKERDGVPSLADASPAGRAPRARYRAATRAIVDVSTAGGAEMDVSFAERAVVVLLGDEPRDDYEVIKIAEIRRDGSGKLVLDETYIPPVLRVEASPFLMSSARRILSLLTAKRHQLAGERKQRDAATIEYDAQDVGRFLQLNTVNAAVPVLTQLGRDGSIGPYLLYLTLVQIAGQLSTFSPEEDPSTFPAFVYTDLRSTFEELFARMTGLLRTIAREQFLAVPLEGTHPGVLLGKLSEPHVNRCGQYVLAVKSDMKEADVGAKLPQFCKISSYNQLGNIVRAASPGVPLRHVGRPPSEVPIRPEVVYFLLDLTNDYWRAVLTERQLGIYLPPPFDKSKVDLYGIPNKT